MPENIRGDLITEGGRSIKFGKDTGRNCPVCGRGDNPHTLKVVSMLENSALIECPSCGYSENVPSDTVVEIKDIKGRIIKR